MAGIIEDITTTDLKIYINFLDQYHDFIEDGELIGRKNDSAETLLKQLSVLYNIDFEDLSTTIHDSSNKDILKPYNISFTNDFNQTKKFIQYHHANLYTYLINDGKFFYKNPRETSKNTDDGEQIIEITTQTKLDMFLPYGEQIEKNSSISMEDNKAWAAALNINKGYNDGSDIQGNSCIGFVNLVNNYNDIVDKIIKDKELSLDDKESLTQKNGILKKNLFNVTQTVNCVSIDAMQKSSQSLAGFYKTLRLNDVENLHEWKFREIITTANNFDEASASVYSTDKTYFDYNFNPDEIYDFNTYINQPITVNFLDGRIQRFSGLTLFTVKQSPNPDLVRDLDLNINIVYLTIEIYKQLITHMKPNLQTTWGLMNENTKFINLVSHLDNFWTKTESIRIYQNQVTKDSDKTNITTWDNNGYSNYIANMVSNNEKIKNISETYQHSGEPEQLLIFYLAYKHSNVPPYNTTQGYYSLVESFYYSSRKNSTKWYHSKSQEEIQQEINEIFKLSEYCFENENYKKIQEAHLDKIIDGCINEIDPKISYNNNYFKRYAGGDEMLRLQKALNHVYDNLNDVLSSESSNNFQKMISEEAKQHFVKKTKTDFKNKNGSTLKTFLKTKKENQIDVYNNNNLAPFYVNNNDDDVRKVEYNFELNDLNRLWKLKDKPDKKKNKQGKPYTNYFYSSVINKKYLLNDKWSDLFSKIKIYNMSKLKKWIKYIFMHDFIIQNPKSIYKTTHLRYCVPMFYTDSAMYTWLNNVDERLNFIKKKHKVIVEQEILCNDISYKQTAPSVSEIVFSWKKMLVACAYFKSIAEDNKMNHNDIIGFTNNCIKILRTNKSNEDVDIFLVACKNYVFADAKMNSSYFEEEEEEETNGNLLEINTKISFKKGSTTWFGVIESQLKSKYKIKDAYKITKRGKVTSNKLTVKFTDSINIIEEDDKEATEEIRNDNEYYTELRNKIIKIPNSNIDILDTLSTMFTDNECNFLNTLYDQYFNSKASTSNNILIRGLSLITQTKTMADYMQLVYIKHLHESCSKNKMGLYNNYFCGTFDKLCALTGLEMGCPMLFEKIEGTRAIYISYGLDNNINSESLEEWYSDNPTINMTDVWNKKVLSDWGEKNKKLNDYINILRLEIMLEMSKKKYEKQELSDYNIDKESLNSLEIIFQDSISSLKSEDTLTNSLKKQNQLFLNKIKNELEIILDPKHKKKYIEINKKYIRAKKEKDRIKNQTSESLSNLIFRSGLTPELHVDVSAYLKKKNSNPNNKFKYELVRLQDQQHIKGLITLPKGLITLPKKISSLGNKKRQRTRRKGTQNNSSLSLDTIKNIYHCTNGGNKTAYTNTLTQDLKERGYQYATIKDIYEIYFKNHKKSFKTGTYIHSLFEKMEYFSKNALYLKKTNIEEWQKKVDDILDNLRLCAIDKRYFYKQYIDLYRLIHKDIENPQLKACYEKIINELNSFDPTVTSPQQQFNYNVNAPSWSPPGNEIDNKMKISDTQEVTSPQPLDFNTDSLEFAPGTANNNKMEEEEEEEVGEVPIIHLLDTKRYKNNKTIMAFHNIRKKAREEKEKLNKIGTPMKKIKDVNLLDSTKKKANKIRQSNSKPNRNLSNAINEDDDVYMSNNDGGVSEKKGGGLRLRKTLKIKRKHGKTKGRKVKRKGSRKRIRVKNKTKKRN